VRHDIVVERDVVVPMRDGVRLAADVYRPAGGPAPALLHRLPYSKSYRPGISTLIFDPLDAVERGFAVVVQDVRGTGASEGVFRPLHQERLDGHDTIDWVSRQSWCSGSVGLYGSSYQGATTLLASIGAPPALGASLAYLSGAAFRDTWFFEGGALLLGWNVRWVLQRIATQLSRADVEPRLAAKVHQLVQQHASDTLRFLASSVDVGDLLRAVQELAPYWSEWLGHDSADEYWSEIDVPAHAAEIAVPVLQIGGWHDGMLKGQLLLHQALLQPSNPDVAGRHRLVVGPWDHVAYLGTRTLSTAGVRSFGPGAAGGSVGLSRLALQWFEQHLGGGSTALEPHVRYFHMGPDVWVDADAWPPAATEQRWHLHSGGRAATRAGDGRLETAQPPAQQPADSYVYDPLDPAPTVGGRHLIYDPVDSGVQDQGELEDRADVLVYTSVPLPQPLTVTGPVRALLYVSTGAPTTDVVATLVDVSPSGAAHNVVDGIRRLRPEDVDELAGNDALTVDLWDTAYTFAAGHRLRLHVTSSSFPRYERNRNVGPGSAPTDVATALIHLLHDREHPSALVLSVADESALPPPA
jgi:putative CocE/NonD family hydrolase